MHSRENLEQVQEPDLASISSVVLCDMASAVRSRLTNAFESSVLGRVGFARFSFSALARFRRARSFSIKSCALSAVNWCRLAVEMSRLLHIVFFCFCLVGALGKTNYAEVRAKVAQDSGMCARSRKPAYW